MNKLIAFTYHALTPEDWASFPKLERLQQSLASALVAQSELSGEELGLYAPPDEIREVRFTDAAIEQIRHMWHGHRQRGRAGPPPISLKVFVFACGQESGRSWASAEVHPGLDSWDIE